MTSFEIIFLGLVQGLTEFFPVSSSGHLLAARILFGISDVDGTAFDAALHIGTLAAVVTYYWRVWWGLITGLFVQGDEQRDKRELLLKLIVATVPAALVGYIWQDTVAETLRSGSALAVGLLATAVALWLTDWLFKQAASQPRASYRDALIIGLAQVAALVPGVSRSGITIAAGRWRGLSRRQAVTFSFLLSAPIIAGAGFSSLPTLLSGAAFAPSQLLLGIVVAFVSGLAAIHLLLRYVERSSFMPFVVYLVALAGLIFLVT